MSTQEIKPLQRDPKLMVNEKLHTEVYETSDLASKAAAQEIIKLINSKDKVVLGLATGSTPTRIYAELIKAYERKEVSFKHVITFNLDEYYPMKPTAFQSYHKFMHDNLFDHIDIPKENIHIPDGTLPLDKIEDFCKNYEEEMKKEGGLDLQILGIGRSGHVGFNEPGSPIDSKTRKIYLDRITRLDASGDFYGLDNVPTQAITMGVGSIMAARRVLILAFSESKASIIAKAIEGESNELCAASLLQRHPNCTAILDYSAASELTYYKQPWILAVKNSTLNIKYDKPTIKKAVCWLSREAKKPILALTNEDYYYFHLNALIDQYGSAEVVNLFVFQSIQDTITGWPTGKVTKSTERALRVYDHPTLDRKILYNPELSNHKKVMVFSPHPDDDVISMGGTIIRMCEQGNEVHTVYETNGSVAVWDDDMIRMAEFAQKYAELFGIEPEKFAQKTKEIKEYVKTKTCDNGFKDNVECLNVKRIIRETEAMDASIHAGVKPENVHFLNLPFYQTGAAEKKPTCSDDVLICKKLLAEVKPEMIFAAGDLSDPHGTHRKCTRCVLLALDELEKEGNDWVKKCEIWLYRGAWQEYDIDRAEMIVPLSGMEVKAKRLVVFKHQSQKDPAMFPGADSREFWQRAEERNKNTADLLHNYGFTSFTGAEAFVRYDKSMCI